MAIARVQGPVSKYYSATPLTTSFVSTPTAGNLLICHVHSYWNATTNASIPGWTLATSYFTGDTQYGGIFYKVAGAAESKDVVLSWTGCAYASTTIEEWGGFVGTITLDQIANVNDTGGAVTSRSSGTTPTTTAADELCLAAFATNGDTSSQTWSNSFTLEKNNANNIFTGSRVVTSAAAYETTLSWTTARKAGGCIVTFKGVVAVTWIPKVIMVM